MDDGEAGTFGGFGGFGTGGAAPAPQQVEVPLKLTLEELYKGTAKRRKVTRQIIDSASGNAMKREETLEIPVKPGWKEGTKITFAGKGDEQPGRPAQDLVFVVQQIPHSLFKRHGDDLIVKVQIPLHKALSGGTIDVPTLDNRVLRIPLKEVVTPSHERLVKNEGMPLSKAPGQKGNLRVQFDIQWPRAQVSNVEGQQLAAILQSKY